MQKCFLTINKDTQVANYLRHRSIADVVEEHRSLSELNLDKIDIVDVDKFIYIYYQTDDSDLSFRSDMNAMRTVMSSAFFHASGALFILVNNENPLLEDLIYSALRDCPITKDKIEVVSHMGALMLSDVGTYLSGSASGQTTTSSYRDVYVTEADKEEKERFANTATGLDSVLPVLTDMAALYKQRSGVEAISAGRVVTEHTERPSFVKDFSRINASRAKTKRAFVVSGDKWTGAENAVSYLINYFRIVGSRSLIINLDSRVTFTEMLSDSCELSFMDIKAPITSEQPIAVINARFNQLGYVIEYLENIKGVDDYVFYCDALQYSDVYEMVTQLCEITNGVFVTHYNEQSVQDFVQSGKRTTALFLCFGRLKEDFALSAFKKDLHNVIVATFPTEDVDYTEFFEYSIGGGRDD